MLDSSPLVFNLIIAGVGLLLFAFLWVVTRDLPIGAKFAARAGMALVIAVPFALAVLFGADQPSSGPKVAKSPPPAPSAKQVPAGDGRPSPPPAAKAVPPAETARIEAPKAPPEIIVGAPKPTAIEPTSRGPQPRALTTAPPGSELWDVVPVYYGTDRASEGKPQRASYSSDRANRLDLGRALVTVPKVHKTPLVERPWVYTVPFTQIVIYGEPEDPAKHFTLKEVRSLSKADLLSFVRERLAESRKFKNQALVFIHGFNTTFDAALYRSAQIAYDLGFDGAPFVYSWPSKGSSAPTSYTYDRESAELARVHLQAFLEMVTKETGAEQVSIIAHSMGHQVLLPVLDELKRDTAIGAKLSEVILAAPDMERVAFENIARQLKGFGRGLTLYASANDKALAASKSFWGGVRAGEIPANGPVQVAGLDTIDVSNTSTDWFGLNHSAYAERTELISDITQMLQATKRTTPKERIPILEFVTTTAGGYWRYPKR